MSKQTNFYEVTYIIDAILDEEEFEKITEKFTDLVKNSESAELDEVDEWGMLKFAYEMKKRSSGYYVNMHFSSDTEFIEELQRQLNLDDNIMRFMSLRYDAKMLRHYERKKKGEVPRIFEEEEEES